MRVQSASQNRAHSHAMGGGMLPRGPGPQGRFLGPFAAGHRTCLLKSCVQTPGARRLRSAHDGVCSRWGLLTVGSSTACWPHGLLPPHDQSYHTRLQGTGRESQTPPSLPSKAAARGWPVLPEAVVNTHGSQASLIFPHTHQGHGCAQACLDLMRLSLHQPSLLICVYSWGVQDSVNICRM